MDERLLLVTAMKAAIRDQKVDWEGLCGPQDWNGLYALASSHHVKALVLEAVYTCPDYSQAEELLKKTWKREAMAICMNQIVREDAFSAAYHAMRAAGLHPLVMKGAVCRALYPNPGLRFSSDEDLLVPPEEFAAALGLLQDRGMSRTDPGADPESAFELGLISPDSLYIELHRSPFSPDSAAIEQCNQFFADVHDRACTMDGLLIMNGHDHMLYLMLHAYKHFIHSGFGLRQLCDIALWAENYGPQIDWPLLWSQCEQVRCLRFAKTVFAAAEAYLAFDRVKAGLEQLPRDLPIQELMEDLLGAGIFGSSTGSRVHSATITLQAVEADRRGERTSALRTIFPKSADLQNRYPYLRKYPVLLPVAWCSRLVRYAMETGKKDNSAVESLELGAKRTQLLRQLDMID